MTDKEIRSYKTELFNIFKSESIHSYDIDNVDSPEYNSDKSTSFARGKRPGDVLAIVSRDGVNIVLSLLMTHLIIMKPRSEETTNAKPMITVCLNYFVQYWSS